MHEMALTGRDKTTCDRTSMSAVHDNPQGFYVNQLTTEDFARIPDPRPALTTVRVPALILAPQCDYIRWPITREYRDVLPNATLVDVRGAGHAVSAEQPRLYSQLLLTFLRGEPLPLPAYTAATAPSGHR
jgi:proline iminopeptidase